MTRPKVDFYCHLPFLVPNYQPIIDALIERDVDARIVIEPPESSKAWPMVQGSRLRSVDEASFELMIETALSHGLDHLVTPRYDDADVAVTNVSADILNGYRCPKVRATYGFGAWTPPDEELRWLFGEWDMLLAYSEANAELMRPWADNAEIVVCGIPKWAPYRRNGIDRDHWRSRWQLDPAKPTIAYFATWSDKAAIDRFAPSIASLSDEYNVVFKPHPLGWRFERDRYQFLRRSNVVVDEDTLSIVPFIAMADIVVADSHTGSLTEALALERPVVALSTKETADELGLMPVFTAASSVCFDPVQLPSLVRRELSDKAHSSARSDARRYFVADLGGDEGVVAAEAIMRLFGSSKGSKPSAVDRHGSVSVIVDGDVGIGDVAVCLDALAHQNSSPITEVFVVEESPGRRLERLLHDTSYPFTVRHVMHPDGIAAAKNEAASKSTGEAIIFLGGDAVVASDYVRRQVALLDGANEVAAGTSTFVQAPPEQALQPAVNAFLKRLNNRVFAGIPQIDANSLCLSGSWTRAHLPLFDESLRSSLIQSYALAVRLQREGLTTIEGPRVNRRCHVKLNDLRRTAISSSQELIALVASDTQLLTGFDMRSSVARLADSVQTRAESASNWANAATDIAQLRYGFLTTSGVAEVAQSNVDTLDALLDALLQHWWEQGTLEGMRAQGVEDLAQLTLSPIPIPATDGQMRLFAWPNYSDPDALYSAIRCVLERSSLQKGLALVVHHDERLDEPLHACMEALTESYERVAGGVDLEVAVSGNPLSPQHLRRFGRFFAGALAPRSDVAPLRVSTIKGLGVPLMRY